MPSKNCIALLLADRCSIHCVAAWRHVVGSNSHDIIAAQYAIHSQIDVMIPDSGATTSILAPHSAVSRPKCSGNASRLPESSSLR